ncbi:hypothetical protein PXH69_21815 [Rhodococcus qingshengii]|uniref:Uncharacterized protein n=1 Tax=Rhodococcus qingshengii TaxID=334542 RepID=A0AAW6LQS3_RHOSG|nr:hypothetical protein [Rhodococcus qingshengii]MDE8647616.1 hypothetical protein [Rhodococcus qingshengii]
MTKNAEESGNEGYVSEYSTESSSDSCNPRSVAIDTAAFSADRASTHL